MRINEPVHNHEVVMKDGDTLVSRTDAGGRMTFVNQAFVDISGFSEQELIGQPHNLVRHPDMPQEAFADLWATIKSGKAWEALVKNRTKSGSYYWVRANVTPLVENGAVTGFMSVRAKPSREDVAAASKLYDTFRKGQQGNRRISEGRVVATGLFARIGRLKQSVIARMAATLIVLLAGLVVVAWLGLSGMKGAHDAASSMYADRVFPLKQLKIVADMYAVNIVDTTHRVRNGGGSGLNWEEGLASLETARKNIAEQWSAYIATFLTPEEAGLKDQAVPLMADADKAISELEDIFKTQDLERLDLFVKETLYQKIDPISAKVSELVELQPRVAEQLLNEINADYVVGFWSTGIVALLGTTLAAVMCFVVYRTLKAPVQRLDRQLSAIARGEYTIDIVDDPIVEYQPITTVIRAMRAQLAYGVLEKAELDRQAASKRTAALRGMADAVESETSEAVGFVAEYTTEMSDGARKMADAAKSVSENSQAVAAAAAETLASTQTVSAATEELASSIREISGQLAQTAGISRATMQASESASTDMAKLSTVVERITAITSVIRDVAAQTNLLALNATIEAARAGDAGKGFAVVANEVKNLAAKTANSTTDIEKTVDEIRAAADTTIASVSGIVEKIREVDSYATSIASAIEEQSAATGEIARSVGQAAEAAKEVAERINTVASQAELSGQQAALVNDLAVKVDDSITSLRGAIVRAVRHVDADVDRRKSTRFQLPVPKKVTVSDGQKQFAAELIDISMGGVRLALAEEIVLGPEIMISLGGSLSNLRLKVKEHRSDMVRGKFLLPEGVAPALGKFIISLGGSVDPAKMAA